MDGSLHAHRSSITSQSKTFRKSKITFVQNNTDMNGHALNSDTMCGSKDQVGQPDRSKSSGSLPQINKNDKTKKAEITNLCQINDFMGF